MPGESESKLTWNGLPPTAGTDRRYTNLEILRIAAAALVIFFHVQQRFAIELGLMSWLNDALRTLGAIGVDVFFVISGFVIALNVARGDSALGFSVARLTRIVPSYWLLTLLAALAMILAPGQFAEGFSLPRLVSSLFFVNQQFGFAEPLISLGWTLNFELRFYLIVALALLLVPKAWSRYVVLAAALAGLVAFVLLSHEDSIMYEFALGFVAFGASRVLKPGLATGIVLVGLGAVGVVAWLVGFTGGPDRWLFFGIPSLLIVLGAIVLPQATNPLLKRLGFASYSTYLTQWFTIPIVAFGVVALNIGETFAPVFFVAGVALCVLAGILYSVVVDERLYRVTAALRRRSRREGRPDAMPSTVPVSS